MKKVTSNYSIVTINHFKNLLVAEGIEAFVKNEHMGSVMGEIPFQDIWPELWVKDDLDYDRALQLIDDSIAEESPQEAWRCKKCGAENEGQFAACWSCSAAL